MSEGEEFILDFLKSENIKFESEKIISSLKGDSKKHRVADFYLPEYKIYIEFFGQWNSEIHKERYREKKIIYSKNAIPCIFLYPENLGIIEYIFHKRIHEEFKRYNLKKELWNYRINEIRKELSENFIFLIIGLLILYLSYPWFEDKNHFGAILGGTILCYQFYEILKTTGQIIKNGPRNRRIFW